MMNLKWIYNRIEGVGGFGHAKLFGTLVYHWASPPRPKDMNKRPLAAVRVWHILGLVTVIHCERDGVRTLMRYSPEGFSYKFASVKFQKTSHGFSIVFSKADKAWSA